MGATPRYTVPGHTARMRLTLEQSGAAGPPGVPVLHLEGEFDIDTVPELDRFLRRRLGPLYERRHLVMDLAGVTFVDSSFIGFLVGLVSRQRQARRELVLARPAGRVRAVLAMVGLPNLVPVYETLEEGLAALREAHGPLIPPAFSAAN